MRSLEATLRSGVGGHGSPKLSALPRFEQCLENYPITAKQTAVGKWVNYSLSSIAAG